MKLGILLLAVGALGLWLIATSVGVGLSATVKNWFAVFMIVSFYGVVSIPCLIVGILRIRKSLKKGGQVNA